MYKESRHDVYSLPLLRRLTGYWRALPDFLIIGAQKAGTTTVYDNLVKHPLVRPADIKEVHFFDNNWHKGKNWYKAHFDARPSTAQTNEPQHTRDWITGEASPYYLFHPLAPGRVKQVCPQARLIVILRNPTERAYSHYHHEARKGREPLSFEQALAEEDSRLLGEEDRLRTGTANSSFPHQHYSYRSRGEYAGQLENWLQHFPREQFLVLESSRLNRDFAGQFQRIYDFLNLPPVEIAQPRRSNVGSYEKMPEHIRQDLNTHYAPHNERLYEILGESLGW